MLGWPTIANESDVVGICVPEVHRPSFVYASANPVKPLPKPLWTLPRCTARFSSRTSHVFAESPSRAAAASIAVFSASGSRNVMRAVMPSSARRRLGFLALLDVHERRLLAGQPDLDVTGRKLVGHLERDLREEVEEPEASRCLERVAQPLGGPCDVLVAQRACGVEV